MRLFIEACLLTVAIETALFAFFGYRNRNAVVIVICANVITNLLLNLTLFLLPDYRSILVPAGEIAVVLTEYCIYAAAFGHSGKLFVLTAMANALSYMTGCLWQYFSHL